MFLSLPCWCLLQRFILLWLFSPYSKRPFLFSFPRSPLSSPPPRSTQSRLSNWGDRTLVVVSHDRAFLNQVCTDVVHLEKRTLTYYQGDWQTFEAVRQEKRLRQQRVYEQQQAKKVCQGFLDFQQSRRPAIPPRALF